MMEKSDFRDVKCILIQQIEKGGTNALLIPRLPELQYPLKVGVVLVDEETAHE